MNINTINRSIERLDAIHASEEKRGRFDLAFWASSLAQHEFRDQPEHPACGFAGCLVGWAFHERWYEDLGFRISMHTRGSVPDPGMLDLRPWFERIDGSEGTMNGECGMSIILGVSWETVASIIFMPSYMNRLGKWVSNVGPRVVADRLRLLLLHGEDEYLRRYNAHEEEFWI